MAAKKPKKPKAKDPKIPQTAAEKEANVQLTIARQLGVSQTRSKQAASSRGAFKERKLRASGDMSRYNLGRFKDDPFPTVPTGGGGGVVAGPSGGTGSRRAPKPAKPKPKAKPKGNREVTADLTPGRPRKKAPSPANNPAIQMDQAEKREAYLKEQARKKAAEAAKKAKAKESTPRARGNTSVAL